MCVYKKQGPTPCPPAHPPPQVGFRHAKIRGRQLLHNNQPIMLKGAPAAL